MMGEDKFNKILFILLITMLATCGPLLAALLV